MTRLKYRNALFAFFVLIVVAFSTYRVRPYLAGSEQGQSFAQAKQITKVVKDGKVPEYDIQMSPTDTEDLKSRIHRKVLAAFQLLAATEVPSKPEQEFFSKAFADYVVLNRTGTREEYLASYFFEHPNDLTMEDSNKADAYWIRRTAWARHSPINIESMRLIPRYINGSEINKSPVKGSSFGRTLADGSRNPSEGTSGYWAYEVVFDATVPSYDAREEFSVEIGIMLTNDGPRRAWSVSECRAGGVPDGKVVFSPRP